MDYYGDFIIPCYTQPEINNDFEYRLRNIKIICGLLPKNMNIIIVEQTKQNQEKKYITELQRLNLFRRDIEYIEKQYDGDFVKGWLYNIGYRYAKTDNLFLAETDVVFAPGYWGPIYEQLNKSNYHWAHCWNKLYIMGESGQTISRSHTVERGGPEGGIVYTKKDFYKRIGGSNEWMSGLGAMDNEFIMRCEYHTKRRYMLEGDIYHLWHPFSPLKGTLSTEESEKYKHNRRRNADIVHSARTNIKLYCQEISKYSEEIGGNFPLCEKIIMFDHTGKKLISTLCDNTTMDIESEVDDSASTPCQPLALEEEVSLPPSEKITTSPSCPLKKNKIKSKKTSATTSPITKRIIIKKRTTFRFDRERSNK